MRTMKNLALAAMAAAALVLAGCGGGGSGARAPGDSGDSGAQGLVGKYILDGTTFSDTDFEDSTVTAANGETVTVAGIGSVMCVSEDGCSGTVEDGTLTITGNVKIVSVDPDLDAETISAVAAKALAMLPKPPVNTAEMTAKAIGMAAALMESMGAAVTDKFDPAAPSVTVSRAMGAGAVIKKTGFAMGDAPMSLDGWTGATLTKKTESVIAYTNIEATKQERKKFSTVWPSTRNGVNNDGVVTIDLTGEDQSSALLDKTDFPKPKSAGGGITTAVYGGPSTATNYKQEATFRGMFQGGAGEYECTTATAETGCTVTVKDAGASGEKYTLGGTWQFTPDPTATAVVETKDSDYLTFGWWIDAPKVAASGDYMFTVRTFASGMMPYDEANSGAAVTALEGDVKYGGSAAGLYAVKNVEGGEIASAMHGAFTADASLTASFGNASAIGTLSGKIDNFQGGMDMSDWSVELKSTALEGNGLADAAGDSTNRTVMGMIGDTKSTGGGWSATLYGPTTNSQAPSGIAGTFQADFTNANIAGAFGATRNE